ncbi:hypothetical protein ZWY2020_034369, partial [Hordeum vulgare]
MIWQSKSTNPGASFRSESKEKERNQTQVKQTMGSATVLEVILAIILPPVGVFLRYKLG